MKVILHLITISILLSGCSMQGVKPWERDLLAQKKMQLDPYPVDSYLDDHIYYSKESSTGGAGVGGGGCGCN
jgi:hypothetical protein